MDYKALLLEAFKEIKEWMHDDLNLDVESKIELLKIMNGYLDRIYRENKSTITD